MSDCQYLEGCPFFNDKISSMPSTADLIKTRYCKTRPDRCARLLVRQKLGAEAVPLDLFPGQMERAFQLTRL